MGTRGPRPGTKYQRRIRMARALPIHTDRQLTQAQRFNEYVDAFLTELEDGSRFPLSEIEPKLVGEAIQYAVLIQEAVIGGIEAYSARRPEGQEEGDVGDEPEEEARPRAPRRRRTHGVSRQED